MLNLNCVSKHSLNKDIKIIEIENFEYGKIGLPYNQIGIISAAFKIKKKYLTSSIYYNSEKKVIGIPINDKTFNYDYFHNFDYNLKSKAKLYVQKYSFNNNEYFVAIKIE